MYLSLDIIYSSKLTDLSFAFRETFLSQNEQCPLSNKQVYLA